MAENERAAQPKDTLQALPVSRDTAFVRIAADDIIVVHRERDVQISLIAEGPEPIRQAIPGKQENGFAVQEIQLTQSYTEIARVGLPSARAFSMAMNIVEAAVEGGHIPINIFRDRFLAMLDEHDPSKRAQEKAPASRRKR